MSLFILEFFHFHEHIMFLKERTIRPSRMPGKMILFQVLCFILLLLDALEAFIWNYYLEQSWSCSYSILSVQLLSIPNQNWMWLSHPTLPILYRSTENSNIEARGFEGMVQSRNNSGRNNNGSKVVWAPLMLCQFLYFWDIIWGLA